MNINHYRNNSFLLVLFFHVQVTNTGSLKLKTFTNRRVKYIEDIVDLWTFLGDADSEIMGSPDSASHTECNSMCLCT